MRLWADNLIFTLVRAGGLCLCVNCAAFPNTRRGGNGTAVDEPIWNQYQGYWQVAVSFAQGCEVGADCRVR
ncbi:hypothetical protein [aff. Roholtiella sp. LEGE 12411]|uniref:hypothetical protein n=1 Tax=aff. Roholtiella sp. LEGE 12411 TaxID=1828822 RepID=UPI001882354C|nr:hypothetical protein [aff. Roholtiella sp. LEGE 12411]MBE9037507.1 hypothetical protein [aff. Roholtiella sp. LEGE 12411]